MHNEKINKTVYNMDRGELHAKWLVFMVYPFLGFDFSIVNGNRRLFHVPKVFKIAA